MDLEQENAMLAKHRRPVWIALIAILLWVAALAALVGGVVLLVSPQVLIDTQAGVAAMQPLETMLAAVVVAGLCFAFGWGLWRQRNWARVGGMAVLGIGLAYDLVTLLFDVSAAIFGGEQVMPIVEILKLLGRGLLRALAGGMVPGSIIFALVRYESAFEENPAQRKFVDRMVRSILLVSALSAVLIVFLIILFTVAESVESVREIGVDTMLLGTIWRPGSIIGTDQAQFGLVPMIVGSILSTFGAAVIGVPLSIGAAILLAEVAPPIVRETVRPAIELLAGIPSVVYGLFGMVVLAPLIRNIEIPYNTGFGILNASIILAVMIIPTITNIAEDAIRAVPHAYKEGALALGATHWQAITDVILPAGRSGIVAAIILGIGRALGETMAVIMVIGNAIAIPTPLNDNPLTLLLSAARTLTGNVAVEINYAAGAHRSALFFTGVLLFVMILLVNGLARFLMRERSAS